MAGVFSMKENEAGALTLTLLCIPDCGPCRTAKAAINELQNGSSLEVIVTELDISEVRQLRKEVGQRLAFPILLLERDGALLSRRWGVSSSDPIQERDILKEWLSNSQI